MGGGRASVWRAVEYWARYDACTHYLVGAPQSMRSDRGKGRGTRACRARNALPRRQAVPRY
jgi:hypothetical protein